MQSEIVQLKLLIHNLFGEDYFGVVFFPSPIISAIAQSVPDPQVQFLSIGSPLTSHLL